MFKFDFMKKKGIVVNHRTGERTGDNDNVKLETNRSRRGMSDLGNLILDVADIFTEETPRSRVQKVKVVSAYIEEAGSDYHLLVTFGDGTSETKTFRWSNDANRALRDIYDADTSLTSLRGSSFRNSTVLVNQASITGIDKDGYILKIRFNNDCAITLKYSFEWDCKNDFRKLGGRERSNRCSFEFSFGTGRRSSFSRINDVLNGR